MQGNPALWIIKMNMDGIHAGEWFRLERLERPYHMSVRQFCMTASTKSSTETGSNIFLRRNLTNSLAKDVHAAIRSKYALRIHPFRLSYKNLDVTFNHGGIEPFISSTASCLRNPPLEWNSEWTLRRGRMKYWRIFGFWLFTTSWDWSRCPRIFKDWLDPSL